MAVALRNRSVQRCDVYDRFQALLDDHPDAVVVAVDITIGLPVSKAREADALARRFVGPRRSSVFPTPLSSVFEAASYKVALLARNLSAAGISKQSLGLAPKILEVDEIARDDVRVVEVHPEVCLEGWRANPLSISKKS